MSEDFEEDVKWFLLDTLTVEDGQVMFRGDSGIILEAIPQRRFHYESGYLSDNGNIYNDSGDWYSESFPSPTHWRRI